MDDTPYRTNPVLAKAERSAQSGASSRAPDDQHKIQFAAIVGPCLHLVAPMSMDEDDRKLWMRAAYAALSHVPFDLLQLGAKAAMANCTHPAKIVPAILEAVTEPMRWRTEKREAPLRLAAPSKAKSGPLDRELLDRMEKGSNELLAAIREMGLKAGYLYRDSEGHLHEAFEPQRRAA